METSTENISRAPAISHQQGGMSACAHGLLPDVAQPHPASNACGGEAMKSPEQPGRGRVPRARGGETCIPVKRAHSTSQPNDWLR
ncbi:MAG: hypothetical protein ACJ8BW_29340 [Ktedonobacteraceae bacterium]